MSTEKAWCEYLLQLSVDELEAQKNQLELEVQGNYEMAESKKLGLLPFGVESEDYEYEAEEAEWRLAIVNRFLNLHIWAAKKLGKYIGKYQVLSYTCSQKGTGAFFACTGKQIPIYQLVSKEKGE